MIIIPARGNSKGIPSKNISVTINDKPILQIAIDTCLRQQDLLGLPIVSSEDEEILELSARWGATPIKRPPMLSLDNTTLEDVITYHILKFHLPMHFPVLAMQCTSPFTTPGQLIEALSFAQAGRSAFAAKMGHWHIHGPCGPLTPHRTIIDRPPRQLDDTYYMETGAFYANSAGQWLACGRHHTDSNMRVPIVIPDCAAHDIDTLEDVKRVGGVISP